MDGDPNEDLDQSQIEEGMPDGAFARSAGSSAQWWLLFGAILLVGAGVFVHLEVWPLLPVEISPDDASCLLGLALVAMLVGGLGLLLRLSMLVVNGMSSAKQRLLPRKARVRCPACGAWDTAEHFVDVQACWQCGADRVQCDRCGSEQPVNHFVSGAGCSACGHEHFATWR